jgi:uncharacterized protein
MGFQSGPTGENLGMNISDLRQKAQAGSVVAQTALGICYLDGINVNTDYHAAFEFLSAAADQGASRAMFNLGRMYAEGLGTAKNPTESIRLYEKASEAGEFLAQIALARIYSCGAVMPERPDLARKWYLAAASQEKLVRDCKEELKEAKAYLDRMS